MTAYLAGVTHRRCTEHPKADEITGAMRGVLAVMSFPARDARSECPDTERFICSLSWASIAKESGYDRDYLRHDLIGDMVALGLVERVGEVRPRQPAHWRLKIHADAEAARLGVPDPQSDGQGWGAETPTVGVPHPQAGGVGTPNPSDSSRPPGREERGRSDAAAAAPLPGGRGSAAAPSMGTSTGTGLVGEIAEGLGYSTTAAEAWMARKLDGAAGPVGNEPAFLHQCMRNELKQRAAPRRPAKGTPASAKGTATRAAKTATPRAGAKRPHHTVRKAHAAEVVAASRRGEPHGELAARFDVTTTAVDRCRTEQDQRDGRAAVAAGDDPHEVAARFPRGMSADQLRDWVEHYRDRERRRVAVEALRRGDPAEQVAQEAGVDVDTVLGWLAKRDQGDAMRRRLERAA